MKGATSGTSSAQKPKPCVSICALRRCATASLSARVSVEGKCSITFGSADMAAKGMKSSSRQGRRMSRSVRSVVMGHPKKKAEWPADADRRAMKIVSESRARHSGPVARRARLAVGLHADHPVRILGRDRACRINGGKVFRIERNIDRAEIVLQLRFRLRAHDDGRHIGFVKLPA